MSGKTIGFVGIGNMGRPMASNLARAGHRIAVYDIDTDKTASLAAEVDVDVATSLAELGTQSATVITMLPNGRIVREAVLGPRDSLADGMTGGALLIDMSSSDPVGTRELGVELGSRDIRLVDAPVSGGVAGAVNASLAIMIGSDDPDAVRDARPVLNVLGKRLFETGPLGSGHAMKALNNLVAAAGFATLTEALIVGRRFGLDPSVMIDILNASTGRSFNSEHTFGREVLNQSYASGFSLDLLAKDIGIAADLAENLQLDLPMIQLTSNRWLEAFEQLGSGRDFTETFRYWNSMYGETGK